MLSSSAAARTRSPIWARSTPESLSPKAMFENTVMWG